MRDVIFFIDATNEILWSYILVAALIGCAVVFTWKSRFIQFRLFPLMVRLLGESTTLSGDKGHKVSSFQAFAVSLASRVGTGNLAGVAVAIAVGGAGAVFWMWVIALLGAATAFVESTLAQLYKRDAGGVYIGGPAYYIESGLKRRWMAVLFAVLIIITFGFTLNSLQSNTISVAFNHAFGTVDIVVGIVIGLLTASVIFGGVERIAKVSSVVVPIMATGYIVVAMYIMIANITMFPAILKEIVSSAFGWGEFVGGGVGATIMQGVKRGLFSNEAGMGSVPNAAAIATTSHPVKQGLVQALGVFIDTVVICSATAFIILFSGVPLDGSITGIELAQQALSLNVGAWGVDFIAIALLFFAFSSILSNYYYGEANLRYITKSKNIMMLYRILVVVGIFVGAIIPLDLAWSLVDVTMALMTLCNLVAVVLLSKYVWRLLDDFMTQYRSGERDPIFTTRNMPDIQDDVECWHS